MFAQLIFHVFLFLFLIWTVTQLVHVPPTLKHCVTTPAILAKLATTAASETLAAAAAEIVVAVVAAALMASSAEAKVELPWEKTEIIQ